jgi:hypothetical protein
MSRIELGMVKGKGRHLDENGKELGWLEVYGTWAIAITEAGVTGTWGNAIQGKNMIR